MALSTAAAAKIAYEHTFANGDAVGTTVAVSTASEITGISDGSSAAVVSDSSSPTQFLAFFANCSNASAVAVFTVFAVDDSAGAGKLWSETVTATASASLRTAHANTSGNYVCTVACSISGKNTLDIFPGVGKNGSYPKIYVTLASITAGSVVLQAAAGRAI